MLPDCEPRAEAAQFMNRSAAPSRQSLIGWLLLLAGTVPILVAMVMILLPAGMATGWASRFGHGEHITPDRMVRLRVVGCVLALAHLILLVSITVLGRSRAIEFLSRFW